MTSTEFATRGPQRRRAVLLLAAVLTLVACDSQPNADEYYSRAWDAYKAGDLRESVILLKNALEQQPDLAEARELLGQAYVGLGESALAEKELTRAAELGYSGTQLHYGLLRSIIQQGRSEEALAELDRLAPVLDPVYTLALRGGAQFGAGRYDEAEQAFKAALELDPGFVGARRGLAEVAFRRGDIDEAERQIDLALEKGEEPFALLLKARIAEQRGDYDGAVAVYDRILEVMKDAAVASIGAARVKLTQGKPDEALEYLRPYGGQIEKSALLSHYSGVAAYQKGDIAGARGALQRALALDQNLPGSLFLLGTIHLQETEYRQAEVLLRRLLTAAPGNPQAHRALALVLLRVGESDQAVKLLAEAVRRDPENAALLAVYGTAQMASGDAQAATISLQRAADITPDTPQIRTQLGQAYLRAGATDRGLEELRAASQISADFVEADYVLALAELQAGKPEQAMASTRKLLEKQPEHLLGWNLLGTLQLADGNIAEGRDSFARAVEISPGFAPAVVNLARLDVGDGKGDQARKRLETVLARTDVDRLGRRGVINELARLDLADGNVSAARERLTKAMVVDPENTEAAILLARHSSGEDEIQRSLESLEQARASSPEAVRSRLMLASYYLRTKQNARALEVAREAAKQAPRSEAVLLTLGLAEGRNGNFDAAVEAARRATEVVPASWRAQYELARWYVAADRIDEARAAFEKTVQVAPADESQALLAFAAFELFSGNKERALELARDVKRQFPDDVGGYNLEADILTGEGEHAQAVPTLERALALSANTRQVSALFRARWRAGDEVGAVAGLDDWLQKHPDDLSIRFTAAAMAEQRGYPALALSHYMDLLEVEPAHPVALNNVAWLHYSAKRLQEALPYARRAHESAPELVEVTDTYGWLLTLTGQSEQGLGLLAKAAREAPGNPGVLYHYAYALWKSGSRDEARAQVEAALALQRPFAEKAEAESLLAKLADTSG